MHFSLFTNDCYLVFKGYYANTIWPLEANFSHFNNAFGYYDRARIFLELITIDTFATEEPINYY